MTNTTRSAIIVVALALGLVACNESRPSASLGPSGVPEAIPQTTPSPTGGALVRGFVQDTAFRPLVGAHVEAIGSQAGQSATTNAKGEFSLTGGFDATTSFRASMDGHIAVTGTLDPSTRGWIYFLLAVTAPPVNVAGDYMVTFIADDTCAGLPAELRTRTYAATITPNSTGLRGWVGGGPTTSFSIALNGAVVQGDGIAAIGVAGDFVAFALFEDGFPYIVEEVAPGEFVAITGHAEVSAGTQGVSPSSTTFSGWIEHWNYNPLATPYRPGRPFVSCESKNHRFTLARR